MQQEYIDKENVLYGCLMTVGSSIAFIAMLVWAAINGWDFHWIWWVIVALLPAFLGWAFARMLQERN